MWLGVRLFLTLSWTLNNFPSSDRFRRLWHVSHHFQVSLEFTRSGKFNGCFQSSGILLVDVHLGNALLELFHRGREILFIWGLSLITLALCILWFWEVSFKSCIPLAFDIFWREFSSCWRYVEWLSLLFLRAQLSILHLLFTLVLHNHGMHQSAQDLPIRWRCLKKRFGLRCGESLPLLL